MSKIIRRSAFAVAAGATAITMAASPALAAGISPLYDSKAPQVSWTKAAYRISGLNRFEVSVNAAKQAIFDHQADGRTFILASGLVWPDAISATPLSGCLDAPVLLVGQNSLGDEVRAYLSSLKGTVSRVIISGGPATVSPAVEAEVMAVLGGAVKVERNGGADRYQVAYNNAAETSACYHRSTAIAMAHNRLQADTAAEANYQAALAAYNKAYADYGTAKTANDAANALVGTLSAQLSAEAAHLQAVPFASQAEFDAAFAAWSTAAGNAAADNAAKAFIVNVLGAYPDQGSTTLTLTSTLGAYRAILTDSQKGELNTAEARLGLNDGTTLNAAIVAANTKAAGSAAVLQAAVDLLAIKQKALMEAAKAIAANASILTNMGNIQGQIDAAVAAQHLTQTAFNKASWNLGAAQFALHVALLLRPVSTWLDDDQAALDAARDAAVRASGDIPAFLATGRVFTDALATGPAAANTNSVVLLTQNDVMGTWASKWATLSNSQLVAVGGDAIAAAGTNVTYQVPGADRYEVSVNLATKYFRGAVYPSVASGEIYSDATVGGSFSALYHNPLVLTQNAQLPLVVDNYLRNTNGLSNPSEAIVVGGPATILPDTFMQIQSAITNS